MNNFSVINLLEIFSHLHQRYGIIILVHIEGEKHITFYGKPPSVGEIGRFFVGKSANETPVLP